MRNSDGGRRAAIVDSDAAFGSSLSAALRAEGFIARHMAPAAAQQLLKGFNPGILLWEIEGETDFVREVSARRPDLVLLPMATRPDLRRPGLMAQGAPFIDKGKGTAAAVIVVKEWLTALEAAETPSSQKTGAKLQAAEIDFLAKISHELRTPLNAIIGFSELIIRDSRSSLDPAQQRAFVEDIYVSGKHLLDVINDILDFARAESGKLTLRETETDLAEVLACLNRMVGAKIRDAGLTLEIHLPHEIPRLWCDELQLKRMLLNLLSNATKATASGGQIDIFVECNDRGMSIQVRDTGIGIPSKDILRILEPFAQVDNSFSRRIEGAGLGLALVKAMIEIHGGRIGLKSAEGAGTTVELIFPPERIAFCVDAADSRRCLTANEVA